MVREVKFLKFLFLTLAVLTGKFASIFFISSVVGYLFFSGLSMSLSLRFSEANMPVKLPDKKANLPESSIGELSPAKTSER